MYSLIATPKQVLSQWLLEYATFRFCLTWQFHAMFGCHVLLATLCTPHLQPPIPMTEGLDVLSQLTDAATIAQWESSNWPHLYRERCHPDKRRAVIWKWYDLDRKGEIRCGIRQLRITSVCWLRFAEVVPCWLGVSTLVSHFNGPLCTIVHSGAFEVAWYCPIYSVHIYKQPKNKCGNDCHLNSMLYDPVTWVGRNDLLFAHVQQFSPNACYYSNH